MAKKVRAKSKPASTTAIVALSKDGKSLVVGIGNLRVLLTHEEDSKTWFARGLEIDYAAQGDSEEDVKQKFGDGLLLTIHENLKVYGDIDQLLKVSPQEVWADFYRNTGTLADVYSQLSTHQIRTQELPKDIKGRLPFDGITFIPIPRSPGVTLNA